MSFFSVVRRHFIPLILSVLAASIAFLLFADVSSSSSKLDLNERIDPYVLCTEGKTIIKGDSSRTSSITVLSAQQKANVAIGNIIRTQAHSSATVFWPDGSITRLGEASTITIKSMEHSDEGKTNVDFSLEGGKSWTNIAGYLDPDSNFTEHFDNDTKVAAVRGTVFEVNMANDYVRTEDHAIELQDATTGESLTDLVAGSMVKASQVTETLPDTARDAVWTKLNESADQSLSRERLERLKNRIQDYYTRMSILKRWQNRLRDGLGMASDSLPFDFRADSGSVTVSVNKKRLERLTPEQVQELMGVYRAVSSLESNENTLESREQLRNALRQALPAEKLQKFRAGFARASLYDSWDATDLDLPERKKALQQEIDDYVKDGVGIKELRRIQQSIPKERLERWNSRVEQWKKRGFNILSEQDWSKKVLEIDEKGIMDNIRNFNEKLDSITGK